ncbi:hypothetical protein AYO20_02485 [Fonsecaea nubica]|uniref:SET domain-containing protein n=1 Tax=Fonsecaea nubica TaxID=856822 RepID=A0A178D9X8_9EURO|nr:hypothetical protein AYO20_02485 [Fonsecaea nubica]OAL38033.1 hypothetical protein AYO20_02485 [Fonsecaea nubica]
MPSTSLRKSFVPSGGSMPASEQLSELRKTDLSTVRKTPESRTINHEKSPSSSRFAVSSPSREDRHKSPLTQNKQKDGTPSDNAKPLRHRPTEVSDRVICDNCAQHGFECDGQSPICGLCKEHGVACSYRRVKGPTKGPPSSVLMSKLATPAEITTAGATERPSRGEDRSSSESVSGDLDEEKGTGTSSPELIQGQPLRLAFRPAESRDAHSEQDEPSGQQSQEDIVMEMGEENIDKASSRMSKDDRSSDTRSISSGSSIRSAGGGTIRPHVKIFKSLMESCHQKLRASQQAAVKAALRQISIDEAKYPGPDLDPNRPDPFAAITAERRRAQKDRRPSTKDYLPDPVATLTKERQRAGKDRRPSAKHDGKLQGAPPKPLGGGAPMLPKFRSVGRVNASFLAPNYRTANHRAYDMEDETEDPDASRKYEEFEERHKIDFPGMAKQRKCQELVWLWQPWIEDVFSMLEIQRSDVLYFYVQDHFEPDRQIELDWPEASRQAWTKEQKRRCKMCGLADPESRQRDLVEQFERLPRPDDRRLVFAGLLAYAFHEQAGSSLWHISFGGIIQPRYPDSLTASAQTSDLCLICFRHNCPDHGAYVEPANEMPPDEESRDEESPDEEPPGEEALDEEASDESEDMETPRAFINDPESDRNIRKFVSRPSTKLSVEGDTHLCGIFCVDPSTGLRQLLGRQPEGYVGGAKRMPESYVRPVLADDEFCCSSCFWDVNNRRDITVSEVKFQPFLSQSQKATVDSLMRFYLHNQRGPCLISRVVKDVGCMMVFNHIIFSIFRVKHSIDPSLSDAEISPAQPEASAVPPNQKKKKNKKNRVPIIDVSNSAELHTREPFVPCHHKGPCQDNPACSCAKAKVHCEWFCGCDIECKRRFRGCNCKASVKKTCFQDARCECWKLNRECDPHLCLKCGVLDVLDSFNKYRVDNRQGRCRNNRIQLGLPAKTTKAPSQVQGYGLYSVTSIPRSEFIGEYVGEVVSRQEADRRGSLYHLQNQEYLFNLNAFQEIDASVVGNKMRFMNNSQKDEFINVDPKSLLCSGQVRIGLFARRNIRAGEELLWKYGYSDEHVKNFWEPGDKPSNERALIPLSHERLGRTTGTNMLAGEGSDVGQEQRSQSPVVAPVQKRKREVSESTESSPSNDDEEADSSGGETVRALANVEIDDSEDEDYEGEDDAFGEDDLDEELDDGGPQKRRVNVQRHSRGTKGRRR